MTAPIIETQEQLHELASLFRKSRVLLTGFELGVFTAIGDGSHSSAAVAAVLKTNERGTDRLLNALCALGVLLKEGGSFRNTPLGLRLLVASSPEYLSGMGHSERLYQNWATLTESVRAGGAVVGRPSAGDETTLAAFIGAMHQRARAGADRLAAALDLSGVSRTLDVGGGSGVYSLAFATANANLTAVVFDLPAVVPITDSYIREAVEKDPLLSGRVTTKAGDYLDGDFGSGYDLVLLSAIVHINSFAENKELVARCFKSLNPGGRIVIQDHVMSEDRIDPPAGALFALNMLVNTPRGDTYTESEIVGWLKDAGCAAIERIELGLGSTLMIGRHGAKNSAMGRVTL